MGHHRRLRRSRHTSIQQCTGILCVDMGSVQRLLSHRFNPTVSLLPRLHTLLLIARQ